MILRILITSLISLKYENQLGYNYLYMERKNLAIGIVVFAAVVASVAYIAFVSIPTPPGDDVILVVGTRYSPIDLDPQVDG